MADERRTDGGWTADGERMDGGWTADGWRMDSGFHIWIGKVGVYGGLLNIEPMRNCHIKKERNYIYGCDTDI